MAPHWKCGSGQPVAGSNPALSATSPRGEDANARPVDRGRRLSRPSGLSSRGRRTSRPRLSFPGRARRGTSGALYLQSAPAGLNPLPRSPFSDAARRATLRTGSRAAANREPCQVRKEAALSDHRRVPRNGLVRAARHGGHGERSGRRRVHGNSTPARPPRTGGGRDARPSRTRPSTAAGAPRRSARSSARKRSSRRSATPSARTGSATRSCSSGRAAPARPRSPGSWPRPSTARTSRTATPATRCPSCVSIREGTTLDLIEIDAASNRGIDDVRDLRERLPYPPGQLRRKVYILDEAHQITKDAWNALLKSLEEPPDFVIFMFASTEPSGFPPAILSRLQRFDVRRLTVAEIEGKLDRILEADGRIGRAGRGPPHRPARRRRDARRRVDARPAPVGRARAHRRGGRPRPARPGRRRGRRRRSSIASSRGDGGGRRRPARRRSRSAAATSGRCSTRRSTRSGPSWSPASPTRPPSATTRRRSPPPAGGWPRSTRTAPASAACASSSSSRCSRRPASARVAADRRRRAGRRRAATAPPSRDAAAPAAAPSRRRRRPRRAADAEPASAPPRRRPRRAEPPAAPSRPSRRPPEPDRDAAPRTPGAAADPAAAPEPGAPGRHPADRPDRRRPRRRRAAADRPRTPSSTSCSPRWPTIVAPLSADPPTKPLIVDCRPVAVDGAIVTLGFPEEQAFLKDAAERRRPAIEAGIARGPRPIRSPSAASSPTSSSPPAAGRRTPPRARRGAPDLRRRPGRRRRGQLTAARRGLHADGRSARLTDHDTDERRHPMGMANLQRMAQQMQQEMLRVQAELEATIVDGSAGGGVVNATRHRQAGARQRHDRSVGGRPGRRRDAPGPRRRRGQRRAPGVARAGRAEDGRRDRRAPPARDVGRIARWPAPSSNRSPG